MKNQTANLKKKVIILIFVCSEACLDILFLLSTADLLSVFHLHFHFHFFCKIQARNKTSETFSHEIALCTLFEIQEF